MITPQEQYPKLTEALGLNVPLYLKREDLHPYGSHKGRSIPHMIETHAKGGHTKFAISSSGNAALAAAKFIGEYNSKYSEGKLNLQIYVGEHVNKEKYGMLMEEVRNNNEISITQTEKPKQTVHVLNKKGEAKSLRQSIDPLALIGYQSLVEELRGIPNIGDIFVPTSSGTVAEALASHFPTHVVQTTKCHPIAELFDRERQSAEEESLADAIVDNVAPRKDSLTELIKTGYIVTNDEILLATRIVKSSSGLDISPNSALSVAGLMRALSLGFVPEKSTVCLITGR